MIDFENYKKEGKNNLGLLCKGFGTHDLDEQAIPSYLHQNPLVSFTFWKRLQIAAQICALTPMENVLDFGCGAGALFPFFAKESNGTVYAHDVDKNAIKLAQDHANNLENKVGKKIFEILTEKTQLDKIPASSLDAIVALDVLEHVEDLDKLLTQFYTWLRPSGQLIVSSPTESWLYKFTRKFGSDHYHGHTHLRGAKDIKESLGKVFKVETVARLYPIFNYFILERCTK